MSDPVQERSQVAIEACRRAGQLAVEMFRDHDALKVDGKGLQDRVSNADRAVEEMIREIIGARFAGDGFVGEESGSREASGDEASGIWVVDPIDGTDCFVFQMPSWSISIAWVFKNRITIGIVYDPIHDEMFSAMLGRGAFLNGRPIQASGAANSRAGIVGIGHSTRIAPHLTLSALERLIDMGGMFQRCGSGALSLAWVAAGRLIGYYEPHMNAWDCLAGLLLVDEAGGWTNDFLADDGLAAGNRVLAAAPGMVDDIKIIGGVA